MAKKEVEKTIDQYSIEELQLIIDGLQKENKKLEGTKAENLAIIDNLKEKIASNNELLKAAKSEIEILKQSAETLTHQLFNSQVTKENLEEEKQLLILENQGLKQELEDLEEILKNNSKEFIEKIEMFEIKSEINDDVQEEIKQISNHRYNIQDKVYYPSKYARMPFRIMGFTGVHEGIQIYRITSSFYGVEENFVLESDLEPYIEI